MTRARRFLPGAAIAALASTMLTPLATRAQDDATAPLPAAAAAQISPATLPDDPVPPDIVPPPAAGEEPASSPGSEEVPGPADLEDLLDGDDIDHPLAGQRPVEPAMTVARALSGVLGCMVCSPLGALGGMLIGMSSYAIWLAAVGETAVFGGSWLAGLPYFGFAGGSIGGALAAPLGTLAVGAAVDLQQPRIWPLAIAAAVGIVGALAPVGAGIAMYEVSVNSDATGSAARQSDFQLLVLAPAVAALGILGGGAAAVIGYAVSYPLFDE
ncbi:MAG: hypothetical protein JXR83_15080 [Deltaproteobacteria bacterium]|nr:hypothetical protein [Deltaproteobacteria bacterium]